MFSFQGLLGGTSNSNSPAPASSRRSFLTKTTLAAIAAVPAASLLSTPKVAKADMTGSIEDVTTYFREIQQHEADHVAFLVKALGSSARPKPTFQGLRQKTLSAFLNISQALENTGVGAYLGAAPAINSSAYLAAAGSIFAIEARHAGYLNGLQGDPLTGHASDLTDDEPFETPLTAAEVVAAAGPFVKSLNGGAALTYSTKRSAKNDVAILNFALALEYLESEFYNTNVHLFLR